MKTLETILAVASVAMGAVLIFALLVVVLKLMGYI